jgi:hypothetical protein
MKLTLNLEPAIVGGIMRYASDKGGISWESACAHLLIRALAHFGYL